MASGKPPTRFEPLSPHHLKYSILTCCESSALDHAATEGIVSVCDQPRPLMVQAVYDMFDLEPVSADLGDSPSCRFIFIGRNLIAGKLKNLFEECIIQDDKLA
uniref:(California timema) hypothetical protein n=1 Tax=Timema californicum TaxID=61474 RepID=A0A7R9P9J8_TIMCA|nr:unnamed protein product [Timema californicum]